MLLWLTLTLFWSTTCWAQLMYGNGGGTYFSSPVDEDNDITGIRVSVGPIGLIKSIQVKHGSNWSEIYGVSGEKLQEFLLLPGEHITAVYGMHRIYIRYLFLYTDIGRWAAFGKEGGHSFVVYPEQRQKVLTGLYGRYKGRGLTGVGFMWDYPRNELSAEQQSEGTDGRVVLGP